MPNEELVVLDEGKEFTQDFPMCCLLVIAEFL